MNEPSEFRTLRDFLGRRVSEQEMAERNAFDDVAGPFSRRLVVYGAGKLGETVVVGLRHIGIEPLALVDANPVLWGREVAGLRVLSPAEAIQRFALSAAFVVAIWRRFQNVRNNLNQLGCASVVSFVPLFWKYAEVFLPHYRIDLPHHVLLARGEVEAVLNGLADGTSKREFVRQVLWMISSDFEELEGGLPPPAYFPADLFTVSEDDRLADCGAFDGDTLRVFAERTGGAFEKVWAFEPDPTNLANLLDFVRNLPGRLRSKVEVCPLALSDRRERLRFDALGTVGSSISATGGLEVECCPLDEVVGDGAAPTIIKMDIEGAELDALQGGERLIRESSPTLAVCVYHRPSHFWEIPLWLAALPCGYRLYLRRYAEVPWDLVCYAVPEHRYAARVPA